MSTQSSKSTSTFSVNIPQSTIFSNNIISRKIFSRIDEINAELEKIFSVEEKLSSIEELEIFNMQLQIKKISEKYQSKQQDMIPLDEMRILKFQERIEKIYHKNEPSHEALIYAEKLMQEKEMLILKDV